MPYDLLLAVERRFSLKILAHKVRRHLPHFAYQWLLVLRYAFFRRRCKDAERSQLIYSDGPWQKRKTTSDLLRIEAFLQQIERPLAVLQIGIGNSSLFEAIGANTSRFTGITISEDELRYANEKFQLEYGKKYDARLMNKYSDDISKLDAKFDFIVDNDLSSYACCHYHFGVMLNSYRKLLTSDGAILVGIDGLGYFDSGFGLTHGRISRLATMHDLVFKSGPEFHMLQRVKN